LAGCVSDEAATPANQEVQETLDANVARNALIEMLEGSPGKVDHREDFLRLLLPSLRTDPIEVVNEQEVTIGRWHCNLKEAKFHVYLDFPNALLHSRNEWHGKFEITPERRWRAIIESSMSGG
jgi:hypothetical protein